MAENIILCIQAVGFTALAAWYQADYLLIGAAVALYNLDTKGA